MNLFWLAYFYFAHVRHCTGVVVTRLPYGRTDRDPMFRQPTYTREEPCPRCAEEPPMAYEQYERLRAHLFGRTKVPSRFTHSHEDRVAPKASARLPHRGWDVSVTLEHGTKQRRRRNDEVRAWGVVDKRDYQRPVMDEATHIAEELAHARELDDLRAITEDELEWMWLDEVGRSWDEDEWLARYERDADIPEDDEFVTYAELMQAPTEVRVSAAFLS